MEGLEFSSSGFRGGLGFGALGVWDVGLWALEVLKDLGSRLWGFGF